MESPRTADQFFAETTRQTVRQAASFQDALNRYLDEMAAWSRTQFESWTAMQQAGAIAAFDAQRASMQAARPVLDSIGESSRAMLDQWAQAGQHQQTATLNVMAATAHLMSVSIPMHRD